MNTKKEFGNFTENIIALRCANMFRTASDFADFLKIDAKRYSEVENGRLHPDDKLIRALLKKYSITLDQMKFHTAEVKLKFTFKFQAESNEHNTKHQ